MVAPTKTTVPSSTYGRKTSCCARLKRWTSSTKSSVPAPLLRRFRAPSNILRSSATPEKTAEIGSNSSLVCLASSLAIVVFPQPGGPQRIIEESRPAASIRPMLPLLPSKCPCPTTSSSCCGLNLSASGENMLLCCLFVFKSDDIVFGYNSEAIVFHV